MLLVVYTLSMPGDVDWSRINVEIHQIGNELRLKISMNISNDYLALGLLYTFFPMSMIFMYESPSSFSIG